MNEFKEGMSELIYSDPNRAAAAAAAKSLQLWVAIEGL